MPWSLPWGSKEKCADIFSMKIWFHHSFKQCGNIIETVFIFKCFLRASIISMSLFQRAFHMLVHFGPWTPWQIMDFKGHNWWFVCVCVSHAFDAVCLDKSTHHAVYICQCVFLPILSSTTISSPFFQSVSTAGGLLCVSKLSARWKGCFCWWCLSLSLSLLAFQLYSVVVVD